MVDLEMDYNDNNNNNNNNNNDKKHSSEHKKKSPPPTPSAEFNGDFGGCISGLGSDFTKNLSDGLNFMFDVSNSSSSSSNNDDKLPSHHKNEVDESVVNEAWQSRPGTPDNTNGHHHK